MHFENALLQPLISYDSESIRYAFVPISSNSQYLYPLQWSPFYTFHKVSSNLLKLKRGDDVEFRLFLGGKGKKNAGRNTNADSVRVLKLVDRDSRELMEYLKTVNEKVLPVGEVGVEATLFDEGTLKM